MFTVTDFTDLGILLAFAMRPTQRPGRSPEYRRVLARYRTEVEFRSATDAVLHGLDASALSDGDFGLILGVQPESPLAFRFSEMPNAGIKDGRLLAGLVLVGLAAWAFPTPADLDDQRPRRVPEVEFEGWLRTTCERLQLRDAAGEPIPEEGLDEAWRVYEAMPATMIGDRGRGARRLSPKCSQYWVRNVLGWLAEQGMARPDTSATADPAWTLTERFRVQVKDMAGERAYEFLAAVGRGEAPEVGTVGGLDPADLADPVEVVDPVDLGDLADAVFTAAVLTDEGVAR
jgi:hypothetical protein